MATIVDDSYGAILSRSFEQLRAKTDITQLVPGAKARALLEIVSREIGDLSLRFNKDLLQAFVKNATGENLDLLADLLGLTRRQPSQAAASATQQIQRFYVDGGGAFGSINGRASIVIPAGTRVLTTGDPATVYITTAEITCAAAATEAWAAIRSEEFGVGSYVGMGTLTVHDFENYTGFTGGLLKTTNIEGIIHATEVESDTNFRYRIMNRTLEAEKANLTSVRLAALSVSGVADVLPAEYFRGIGTGAFYIKAITPTVGEVLLSRVQDEIDRAKAYGSYIQARAPDEVGVELEAKLLLRRVLPATEDEDLRNRVRDNLFNYINGLDIGDPLEITELLRVIQNTDTNIKKVGTLKKPFEAIYIWRYSPSRDSRSREKLTVETYNTDLYERVICEATIEIPIILTTTV